MLWLLLFIPKVWSIAPPIGFRPPDRKIARCAGNACSVRWVSALTLLVARVVTDNHDATVPANNLAVIANALNAWLDLHSL